MQNRRGPGKHSQLFLLRPEIGLADCNAIFANRYRIKMKFALGTRPRRLCKFRMLRLQHHFRIRNWPVLRVMHNPPHSSYRGSKQSSSTQQQESNQKRNPSSHDFLLHENTSRDGNGRPEASARSELLKNAKEFLQTEE